MPGISHPLNGDRTPRSRAEADALEGAECHGCGALIYWVVLPSGKKMPLDRGREVRVGYVEGKGFVTLGVYTSHFATCPEAKQFRNGGGK